jgi:hypothetical protein
LRRPLDARSWILTLMSRFTNSNPHTFSDPQPGLT